MTFYQWRTQLRVYHALVLLADGHDTTNVAHACGWSNPSGFIAAFTDIVGTTPGRYQAGRLAPTPTENHAGRAVFSDSGEPVVTPLAAPAGESSSPCTGSFCQLGS
jgi:AraC-like DNA-binding protein